MPSNTYRGPTEAVRPTTAHLPPDLYQYVEARAKVLNLPISRVLRSMVQEHFDNFVKGMKPRKNKSS